jgi:hypothetical protein
VALVGAWTTEEWLEEAAAVVPASNTKQHAEVAGPRVQVLWWRFGRGVPIKQCSGSVTV